MTFLAENNNYLDHDYFHNNRLLEWYLILDEPSGNGFVFLSCNDNKINQILMCAFA
jgi:hypothetical protein